MTESKTLEALVAEDEAAAAAAEQSPPVAPGDDNEAKRAAEARAATADKATKAEAKKAKAAAAKAQAAEAKAKAAAAAPKVATSTNLVIVNTKRCMISLPPVKNAAGHKIYDTKRLIPGQNDVDAGHWEAVAGNKAIKLYKASGILRSEGPGEAQRLDKGLDALLPEKAREAIAKQNDMGMLNKYHQGTKVEEYHKLIDAKKVELVQNA